MTKLIGSLLSLFAVIGSAQATPFLFTFHDTVGGWAPCYVSGTCPLMPGVSVGDLVTVSVTVDNGQNTLESQSWYQADVISATATVGSYFGEFTSPFHINDPIFRTDAFGSLAWVGFYDVDLGNPDSLGNSVVLTSNALSSNRSDGSIQYVAFFQNGLSNSSAHLEFWSISTAVPEPSTLALLGLGLAGLAFTRRRKH